MPLVDDPKNKGDLVIHYDVSFPTVLNPQQKTLIRQAFIYNMTDIIFLQYVYF